MAIAAPTNYSTTSSVPSTQLSGQSPGTGTTGYDPNRYFKHNAGINNPQYPGLTSTTNQPPAYNDIGGGVTFGIATPDQYVSTQLARDLQQNSPYMKLARQSGLDFANQRGGLNSSIAAGASQRSAIEAAMPMAQADAAMLANLQKTNLQDKTAEDTAMTAAEAQMSAAATAANASMTNNANSLAQAMQAQRENLAFQGEQKGLDRDWTSQFAGQEEGYALTNKMQDYYNQSGILGQSYQQQLGYGQFQLGSNLLLGSQQFYNQAGWNAMNNPAIMGNPEAFGGYLQFMQGPFNNYIDNIFSNIFGGG